MRKYAGVLLMVCLIAGSAFATNNWTATTGSWGSPPGSANTNWNSNTLGNVVPGNPAATEQVKIADSNTCTVDVTTCVFGTQKLTVGTTTTQATLNIVSGGTLNAGVEVQVGDASGKNGRITQTGGTVNLVNGTSSAKLEVGYKDGVGYYTISGGTIAGDATYSQLLVGASGANGGNGTFTVQGTGGSISFAKLYVGVSTSTATYTGTGTLAFEIDGGVSAINAGSVYIDPTNIPAAVANLSVTKTGALPTGDIILINNTGASGIQGAFDNVAWGSTITLGGVNYTLTNTYIGGLDGLDNDVALIPDTNTLTYTAGANGSITGTTPQTVDYGTDGTAVTAVPSLGYHFVNWSDASTQNPRTDLNVTANISVTANFAIDTFTLTYTAGANGSIIGTTPQTVNYGTDGAAVTAQPALGYHFVNWSDASTQNPRTDLNVTANISVTASFAIDTVTFTLTYTAGANGSIIGTTPQTVNYGTDGAAVTAVPALGYHFVNWSDASTQNPRTDLNVTANISVTANFAIDTFTLTYTAGANGSIIGTTPQTVNYGTDGAAVTAQPALGYHFVKWSDDSTQNPRTDLNVTANITVQASFAIDIIALVPAFPGAEGSGCWATGGRGGDVYEVTNLTNAGPGSIVDALSQGNRTIVFRVSGTIELNGVMLKPKSNTTIAGQTAPGDGICIKGRIHILGGVHDIIIRYIRIRVDEGAANSSGDAIDIDNGSNIIIDHVSASYARDEAISCQEDTNNVTVQWCIISESLTFESHSYGSLVRGAYGQQKSYHHNLYAHNNGRNPRPGNYTATSSDPEGLHFDFRNNVVYNWDGGHPGYNADTSSTSRYNFVGNVFIRGVESSGGKAFKEDSNSSYAYWSGNAHGATYGTIAVPSDQWSLVTFNGFSSAQIDAYKGRSYEIPMEPVTTTSASVALTDVLASAGTSFPSRDSVDTRIANDVINGTGGSIANTSSSSWPVLNSLPAPVDTDHDGMPDTWEITHGLNPDNAADRNNYDLDANYTNLEVYLYRLVTGVEQTINLTITRCKVTAGKVQGQDVFEASGTLALSPLGLYLATQIDVNIVSLTDGNVIYPESIDFNYDTDVVNNKYKHSAKVIKGEAGNITSMTLDFRKGTFAIVAKNIDLTGLACPLRLEITMGNYTLSGDVDETIVNGTKTIPTRLMRMYKDTLVVPPGKAKVKSSASSDSLSVTGDIAVIDTDVNLCSKDVNFVWGTQTFSVPPGSFKPKGPGHVFRCLKVAADANGNTGVVTAQVDMDKATFTLSVTGANVIDTTPVSVPFGIRFADFNETDNLSF
jgi:hypothetical protein